MFKKNLVIFIIGSLILAAVTFIPSLLLGYSLFCYWTYSSKDALGHCNWVGVWGTYALICLSSILILFLLMKNLLMRKLITVLIIIFLSSQLLGLLTWRLVQIFPYENVREIYKDQIFIYKWQGFPLSMIHCDYYPNLYRNGERISTIGGGFPKGKTMEPEEKLQPGDSVELIMHVMCGIYDPESVTELYNGEFSEGTFKVIDKEYSKEEYEGIIKSYSLEPMLFNKFDQ